MGGYPQRMCHSRPCGQALGNLQYLCHLNITMIEARYSKTKKLVGLFSNRIATRLRLFYMTSKPFAQVSLLVRMFIIVAWLFQIDDHGRRIPAFIAGDKVIAVESLRHEKQKWLPPPNPSPTPHPPYRHGRGV